MSLWNIQMSWIKHLCHFHWLIVCPSPCIPVSLSLSLTVPPYSQTAHSCPFQPHRNPFCCPSRIRYPFHWKTNCKCLRLAWLHMCVCVSVWLCVYLRMFQFLYWKLTKFAKRWEKVDEICNLCVSGGGRTEQRDSQRERETIKQRRIKANKLVTFTSHTHRKHTHAHTRSHIA